MVAKSLKTCRIDSMMNKTLKAYLREGFEVFLVLAISAGIGVMLAWRG